jgi:NADPH:quinone reductase-like Zn-dependent oxidoreductase
MRAIVLTAFGGTDCLEEREVPDPVPGPGEAVVRIEATSANPFDVQQRRGDYREELALPAIVGSDVAGVVEACGPGVRELAPGDEVIALLPPFTGRGSYAERVAVDELLLARKPAGLDHVEAACLPVAGGTAWEALVARGGVRVGETVLVHAAAGGVGSFAVQIARAAGARVLATCSARNLDFVASLGADLAIDYTAQDVAEAVLEATGGEGVDLVLDTVGGETIARSAAVLRPFGRLVTIVDIATPQNLLPFWERNLDIRFVFTPPGRRPLEGLRPLVERGLVRPRVERVLPLSRVAEAHERLERGGVRGKLVLVPDARTSAPQ